MRLLPPKVQLQIRDSAAGSVPGNLPAILSFDNITSSYRSYFADTDTILFQRQVLEPGVGVLSGSNWITSSNQIVTGGFYVDGNAVKGIADDLAYRRREELPSIRPYFDLSNPAVDGKSSGAVFYATGSTPENTGEELFQPVWSKAKLEIDLTPTAETITSLTNEPNGPLGVQTTTMTFWDNTTKLWTNWKPTGYSMGWNSLASVTDSTASVKQWLEQGMVGFGGSAIPTYNAGTPILPISQALSLLGRPITNFGFPDHGKFAVAPSGTIPMSAYISRPFLAEKIVLIFSGSVGFDDGWFRQLSGLLANGNAYYAAWSFFVLNQRNYRQQMRTHTVKCFGSSSGQNSGFLLNTSSVGETTSRDLVTWMQITHVPTSPLAVGFDDSQMKREWWYSRATNPGNTNITASFEVSGVVKTPVPFAGLSSLITERSFGATGSNVRGGQFIESWSPVARRINSDISERSWNNPIVLPSINATVSQSLGWLFPPSYNLINVGNVYEYPSPYLLLPTDNLILGWQLPVPAAIGWNSGSYGGAGDFYPVSGSGPRMNFYPKGVNKLVIYGSFLEEGKESTEVQDIDPTCVSVRRVIGE
jgi:hypothetical protein